MYSSRKLLFFILLLSFRSAWAGGGLNVTISISPDNPIVGEPVAFTISESSNCNNGLFDPGDGSEEIAFTQSTFEHIYSATQEFSPKLTCNGIYSNVDIEFISADDDMTNLGSSIIVSAQVEPAAAAIPTLGEWGLIILSLIMLGVGMVYLGQRQRTPVRIK